MIPAIALIFGAAWRMCLGGWAHLRRSYILVVGAVAAAAILYLNTSDLILTACAAALTIGYFTIGNGSVLRGDDPAWPYVRAFLTKFIAPAILANGVLCLLGYPNFLALAGMIASLGYYVTWKIQKLDPWNRYAEAIMGASWFVFLAL